MGDKNLSLEKEDEVEASSTVLDDYTIQNSIKNNMVIFFVVIGIVQAILIMLAIRIVCWRYGRARDLYESTKSSMFWNFFLRIWIENYIDMSITNALRVLYSFDFDNWYESLTSSVAIAFLSLGVIAFPFAVTCFLIKNRARVNEPEFQQKWGTLALSLRENKVWPVMYLPIFLGRRLVMVSLIIFAESQQALQIHAVLILTSLIVSYICLARPY